MNSGICIQRQDRNSLAMKATPDGLVVLVPLDIDIESPHVQSFIQSGLAKLRGSERKGMCESLTTDDLRSLVTTWSDRIGVEVNRVQIRPMRHKWASCSRVGTLTLASDLLGLPQDLVEYVICHDLLHLKIPDHGKGFRALMNAYMPDWRDRERRLAAWMVTGGRAVKPLPTTS